MHVSSEIALLIACAAIALVSIPLILRVVPPNRIYGFRTPLTLSNRELWFRANRVAGWAFLVAAAASASIFIAVPGIASTCGALVLVVPAGIALGVSLVYLRRAARG